MVPALKSVYQRYMCIYSRLYSLLLWRGKRHGNVKKVDAPKRIGGEGAVGGAEPAALANLASLKKAKKAGLKEELVGAARNAYSQRPVNAEERRAAPHRCARARR